MTETTYDSMLQFEIDGEHPPPLEELLMDKYDEYRRCLLSTELDDQQLQKMVQFILKTRSYQACFFQDENTDSLDLIKTKAPISYLMFPIATKAIKTGSRSEQVYLQDSDVDYIYEIGPLLVEEVSLLNKIINLRKHSLWYKETKHAGFYTVIDDEGGHIAAVAMQAKIDSSAKSIKLLSERKEVSAVLTTNQNAEDDKDDDSLGEDRVIALPLKQWPPPNWKSFSKRKPIYLQRIMDKLEEATIYLVPKAHPDSADPWIEWRLSFSMVEKEIMLNLPHLYRKVYLICKEMANDLKVKNVYYSYALKTTFMWQCEAWSKTGLVYTLDHILDMVQNVFQRLYKAHETKDLQNYFVPDMNLFELISDSKKESVASKRKGYWHQAGDDGDDSTLQNDVLVKADKHLLNLLKTYTEKESLIKKIIQKNQVPFFPIVYQQVVTSTNNDHSIQRGVVMWDHQPEYRIPKKYHPSHYNLYNLSVDISHEDPDMLNHEWNERILTELYITFLLLLSITSLQPRTGCKEHLMYVLYNISIFWRENRLSQQNTGAGSTIFQGTEEDAFVKILEYYKSLAFYFFGEKDWLLQTPDALGYTDPLSDFFHHKQDPYMCFLNQELPKSFNSDMTPEKLEKCWLTGSLDEEMFQMTSSKEKLQYVEKFDKNLKKKRLLKSKILSFGNAEGCRNVHEKVSKNPFYQQDADFQPLVNQLNINWQRNLRQRLLKEKEIQEKDDSNEEPLFNVSQKYPHSFLMKCLLPQMCEMYNYGFTSNKFDFPTPAKYLSFVMQFHTNAMEHDLQTRQAAKEESKRLQKWGYCVPEDDDVVLRTYDKRLHNTFLLSCESVI
ncbi:uncharacterized protein [Clytia hemisphaerica]|uniref:Mab-21-like HhH/H2TH-like domain-containing protein n=1 Tax=Clytia hemisphaerica TaxID=252671 RepID=A0A7M5UNA0_9CNID